MNLSAKVEHRWAAAGNAFVIERNCLILFRNADNAGLQTPQRGTHFTWKESPEHWACILCSTPTYPKVALDNRRLWCLVAQNGLALQWASEEMKGGTRGTDDPEQQGAKGGWNAPNWAQPAGTAEFEHLLMSVRLNPLFVYYDVGKT